MAIEKQIIEYFRALDESLDHLSEHHEGELTGLPSWVHTTRKITIGTSDEDDGVALRVVPDNSLDMDVTETVSIRSTEDINKLLEPMTYRGPQLTTLDEKFLALCGDMVATEGNNPLIPPVLDNRCLVGCGRRKGFQGFFNIENAKRDAIDLWNKRLLGKTATSSYVREIRIILDKFQAIIKRKAFLERRVHRFIHQYERFMLPSHRRCLYEHVLCHGEEKRKADFILEREQGLPPLLIELEPPVHSVFTKGKDLTKEANHAGRQISEWVSFIDSDGVSNASGEFSFLAGPKERLVIIGRGLEHKACLLETKFSGTVFWTYDVFVEEIRRRLNQEYVSQCRLLGLKEQQPF